MLRASTANLSESVVLLCTGTVISCSSGVPVPGCKRSAEVCQRFPAQRGGAYQGRSAVHRFACASPLASTHARTLVNTLSTAENVGYCY